MTATAEDEELGVFQNGIIGYNHQKKKKILTVNPIRWENSLPREMTEVLPPLEQS